MPDWRRVIEARLAEIGVPPTRRLDIIAEVAQHLDDLHRDLLAAGYDDEAARQRVLADLESDRLVRELARIERAGNLNAPQLGGKRQSFMATLLHDLRYGCRSLRLNPAYTLIVLATLALGIGANTAIFSVADAVMLHPFPYPGMDRIVILTEMTRGGQSMSVAWPTWQDWRTMSQSFDTFGVYRGASPTLTRRGPAEVLSGAIVSSGVFATMGIEPVGGRAFTADDDKPGASRTAIISERLWRSRFDADPAIVGRTIVLNGEPHVVVGVMPAGMRFPSRLTDVWLPLGPIVPTLPNARGAHAGLTAVGKLKPGVSFDRAVAEMDTVARRLEQQYPASNRNVAVQMMLYREQIVQNIRPTLYVLLGAVGFVLLIGCANLANLMLARAERYQREIAVRAALGAERRRIVQQLLTESILLAVMGGGLGVVLAWWMVAMFVASRPATIPRIDLISVDGRVLAFAAALSILTGIVFGLVPALRASRVDLLSSLKQSGRGGSLVGAHRLRSLLVVTEVALALVLLVGAGLMTRSFARLMAIDPGFVPSGVVTMRLSVPAAKYRDLAQWQQFHEDVLQRVAAIPGVSDAGINSAVPLQGGGSEAPVLAEGQQLAPQGTPGTMTLFQGSSPGYLRAMGIPVVRGRSFTARDAKTSTPVAIVDEALVARLFPGQDPIGKHIAFEFRGNSLQNPYPIWREVVGVVRHVRHYGIASEPPFVQLYTPFDQLPIWFEQRRPVMALVVRSTLGAEGVARAVRTEVAAVDPDVPVAGVQTMETYIAQNTEQPRLNVTLLVGLGALALVLAVIGIYGVVSYSVAQRTQEFGVRMALGATSRDVLMMVLKRAVVLIGAGTAIGFGASLVLASTARALLFQVSPHDPATVATVTGTLLLVGVVASVVPALRATRVDPLVALRTD